MSTGRKPIHGEAANGRMTPEYQAWAGMKQRCSPNNGRKSRDYHDRGIKLCARWRDFNNFLADVGRRPDPSYSLDRINNDGNYEPGNVRWTTADVQQANRRLPKRGRWHNAAKYAYGVVDKFEEVLADYAGSKYAVTVESCTAALLLACKYLKVETVEIPKFTYCSVPMSIIHAGGNVAFRDEDWLGSYQLKPYPIYDNARLFTSGMHKTNTFTCVSFHWSKHLPIGRGGAILCDDKKAVEWFKRARFDGRQVGKKPAYDKELILGWHMYMTPEQAAKGLMQMASIRDHNEPLPNDEYPDLSLQPAFRSRGVKSVPPIRHTSLPKYPPITQAIFESVSNSSTLQSSPGQTLANYKPTPPES